MKRVQMFLAGAFIAVGSLCAQSTDAEWQAEVAKLKETIQTNPAQAAEEAEHLIKGKNKKNVELLVAIGNTYLDADKLPEAQEYATLARKANGKSALASVLEGNIAMKQKNAGLASQKYEEAIYFDPKCTEAYLKYADVYKSANASLAIEKLNQLKALEPSNTAVDKKLAEIYYLKNDFSKAAEAYANFAMDSICGGKELAEGNVSALKTNQQVIDYVANNPDAMGVVGVNWLGNRSDTTNLSFREEIRVMSVSAEDVATPANSYKPYQAYLFYGNYPLARSIYALLNDPRSGLPWGFASFMTSDKGQRIILKSGLVPATQPVRIVHVKDE